MFGRRQLSRWFISIGLLAATTGLTALTPELRFTVSAQAQISDHRYQFLRRQSHQGEDGLGGFLDRLFGGFNQSAPQRAPAVRVQPQFQPQPRPQVDYSRAPPPPKRNPGAPPPTTTIVVMGDGMAGWLAYGLEDAFSDTPDVAIVRQDKRRSGLIRYQWHSDLDWWHVAREELAKEKANYVVMMLGLNDRHSISEKDADEQAEKEQQEKQAQDKNGQNKDHADNTSQSSATPARKYPRGIIPFRSDRWATIYSRRIDETIAALKSKGVPVFWVGLPSIRGARSTADAVYLNDLYRARAARAGITYIDIWEGFVDNNGKYSSYGPDYEGQIRRLRSPDGVFFTKYGARKLAHYVEREIRRYMNNRVVNLPIGPVGPLPGNGQQPLVGPVFALTAAPPTATVLDGGPGMHRPPDPLATKVLLKGSALKAPYGRADDFAWPPGSDASKKPAAPAAAAAEPAAAVANTAPTAPATTTSSTAPGATSKMPIHVAPLAPPVAAAKPATEAKLPVAEPLKPERPAAKTKPAEGTRPSSRAAAARMPAGNAKPDEAARRAAARRRADERAADRAQARRLLPPEAVPARPQRNSDPIFGPDGLFGWLH